MGVAHVDDRLRAGERKPVVDFQRGRPALDRQFRVPPRLLRVARDHGVCRVRRTVAVDVRAGREDPRTGTAVRGDYPPQLVELLVPLTRVAKRGDAMTELPQRELRVVLDVEVRIDQTGNHGTAGEIDRLGVGGRANRRGRPDADDALAFDDDAPVLDWRRAAAVDEADVLEHQSARLRGPGGREPE